MLTFAVVFREVVNLKRLRLQRKLLYLSFAVHVICNLEVVGSNPTRGSEKSKGHTRRRLENRSLSKIKMGGYQSGQMGQTVNLLSFDFGGSNPSPPTLKILAEIAQLIEH